jgi:hypothetical protein
MTAYSNTTTARLEAYARARGLEGFSVLKSNGNSAGVFFCVRRDSVTLSRWISLGWTRADAEAAIDRLAADVPTTPSQSGYVNYA